MAQVSHELIIDACKILFGPEVVVSMDFLRYLQPSGVKAAYRKKVLETHPDRAKILGRNEAQMIQQFKDVNDAYKRLYPIISSDSIIMIEPHETERRHTERRHTERRHTESYAKYAGTRAAEKNWADGFYSGRMPQIELLIGRFMYYSSLISWDTLIKALTWQKRQYPLIGQLAISKGFLTTKDLRDILCQKKGNEKFGQCAIRKGYLKYFNIVMLLNKQRMCKRLLGDYFIDTNIVKTLEMERVVKQQQLHNEKIKAAKIRRKLR